MKKFLSILILSIVCLIGNAQTVQSPGFGDGWFAGVNVGAISHIDHSFDWAKHDWLGNYEKEFGVEVGKWLTPVTGVALSYEAIRDINNSKTWADMGTTTGDIHFNLSNLFAGYKGTPRTFEVEFIPSVGFVHYYGDVHPRLHEYMAFGRAALSADFNFGNDKQWTIYVRPAIQYIDRLRHYNGLFDVRAGVTYKFKGTKSKSHNFVISPYSITKAEYDKVVSENRKLRNAPAKVVEKVVEKVVTKTVSENTYIVMFALGDSCLSDDARNTLDKIPEGSYVSVEGYASPDGPFDLNLELSEYRADVVADYLESRGVHVRSAVGHGSTDDFLSNRIAIVTVE